MMSVIPFGVSGVTSSHPRLRWSASCPTLVGDCTAWVHPTLPRTLTVGELAALMGWPSGVIPSGKDPGAQIAKGIVPAAAEWVASAVARGLSCGGTIGLEGRWSSLVGAPEWWTVDPGQVEMTIDLTAAEPPKTSNAWSSLAREPLYRRHSRLIESRKSGQFR